VGLRTAITWSLVLSAVGLLALSPTAGGQQPTSRAVPVPPPVTAPAVKVPIVPGFGNDPPPRPDLPGASTSLQLPRDIPSPFGGMPGRDPTERPTGPPDPSYESILPIGSSVTLPDTARQMIRFGPRYGVLNNAKSEPIPGVKDGQRVTYLGGLIVDVTYYDGPKPRRVEFAADNVIMWVQGVKADFDLSRPLRVERPEADDPEKKKDGEKADESKRVKVEMYLSGNVVIRTRAEGSSQGPIEQTLRANEIYYDVENSKAIAVCADLESKFTTGFDSLHLRGQEIWQLGRHEFRSFDALTYSSKRPADPALVIETREASLVESNVVRRNVFGRPYRNARTGQPDVGFERMLTANENTIRFSGIPLAYFPRYVTDINDPGGPLVGVGFRSDRVMGLFQSYTTWDLFKLLGLRGAEGNRWFLNLDYLSLRGPGVGTDFFYRDLFGSAYRNVGNFSVYGLYDDRGSDLLGGFRGPEPRNPYFRGRVNWTHNQDIFEEGTAFTRYTGQFAYLSDKNFYEQFYKLRFDQDRNQETFAYLYGASGNFAWSALGQVNVNRPWVTETSWLPRVDAALIGESFFDTLVYTGRASAGYARFQPATQEAISQLPSEADNVNTLRADLYQRLSLPFDVGPARIEPYGVMDLTAYSEDMTGSGRGRFYGGGGVKASVPFSRLYADVQSELLNVRGLHHKVELTGNYFVAKSDTDPTNLPLLDRLNDDVSDFSFRSFRRYGGVNRAPNGGLFRDTPEGVALATSPVFDPLLLANRRLIQNRPEILNDMQVLQGGIRQRWQTKRGPEGNDHTVDYMALDLSASFFPDRVRDNFGHSFGQFEYNFVWNIGDRTAFNSAGWFDPYSYGTRYFNLGMFFNRPDGSNLYVGYRHTDPIGSRVFLAVLGYQFSRKYSISVGNAFDFSNNFAQSTSVAFNRTGTDVTMSLGFSYNAFQNNLGVQFLLVPNAALANRQGRGVGNLFMQ
jgi:hypothetical protein